MIFRMVTLRTFIQFIIKGLFKSSLYLPWNKWIFRELEWLPQYILLSENWLFIVLPLSPVRITTLLMFWTWFPSQVHISTGLLPSPSFPFITVNKADQLSALIQFLWWFRNRYCISKQTGICYNTIWLLMLWVVLI